MSIHALTRAEFVKTQALPCVLAALVFTERTAEKPYTCTHAPPEGIAATNNITAEHLVVIHSARPIAAQPSLDVEGPGRGGPALGRA